MLTDLDKDFISYRCDAFLQAIDERLDRLERILKTAIPPEPAAVDPPPQPAPATVLHPIDAAPATVLHPIDDLGERWLSIRAYNCLSRAGITHMEDLTKMSFAELLRIKNLGRRTIEEIRLELAILGLYLKGETENDLQPWTMVALRKHREKCPTPGCG